MKFVVTHKKGTWRVTELMYTMEAKMLLIQKILLQIRMAFVIFTETKKITRNHLVQGKKKNQNVN